MLEEELLLTLTIAVMARRGYLSDRQRAILLIVLCFLMQRQRSRDRYDSDSSSSSSDEEELRVLPPSRNRKKKRQAAEASSSSTDSPTLSVDPEEVDIKEEDFSDTEEKPAKRLKTEPQDLSDTYDEDSKSTLTVKTEPLDKPSSTMGSDPFEPSDLNYYPEVKEEPLDIKEFGEASLINSSEPGTSGVAVKSEADDPSSSNNVNFCEVYLPEETDVRIKQEIELPPDDL